MAYDIDFIKRAVAYKQNGHTFSQLREAFGIPRKRIINGNITLKLAITK